MYIVVSYQKGNRQEEQRKEETRGDKLSVYRYIRHPLSSQNTLWTLSKNSTIYTNSDYTGSLGTASVSTSGKTFSGLRYLSMRNFADNARSSTVWEMNNVQVYDGVTTIN